MRAGGTAESKMLEVAIQKVSGSHFAYLPMVHANPDTGLVFQPISDVHDRHTQSVASPGEFGRFQHADNAIGPPRADQGDGGVDRRKTFPHPMGKSRRVLADADQMQMLIADLWPEDQRDFLSIRRLRFLQNIAHYQHPFQQVTGRLHPII